MTYFHEDQYFRQSWLWALIAVSIVVAAVSINATPNMTWTAIVMRVLVAVFVAALFAFARLETEVRDDGVFVHFHRLWPTRRIPLEGIESYEARRYTLWDSGGWGVHLGLAGMSYNVSGNEGLQFRLKNGSRVLVGTQRATEFSAAMAKALSGR